jgi:hypothetical protein
MQLRIRRSLFAATIFLAATSFQAAAAPIIFTGSGVGDNSEAIAASVSFDFVTHDFGAGAVNSLKITLTNTASATLRKANLLTGVFFTIGAGPGNLAVGDFPTGSSGFDGRAATVVKANGTTATDVDIAPAINGTATDGGYQLSNGAFGTANSINFSAFRYGISTVGMGLTGFNGADLGIPVAGEASYGIFAHGSNVSGLPSLSGARPLIDTSAEFWLKRPANLTSLEQLEVANVRVVYGTAPEHAVNLTFVDPGPPPGVPEPSTMILLGSALVAGGFVARKKRKSAA